MTNENPAKNRSVSKRTRLNLSAKVEIAKEIRSGTPFATLITKYNVGRRTLTRIKQDTESLLSKAHDNDRSLQQKTFRTVRVPPIEERLVDFVSIARQAKLPVTLNVLIAKALSLKESTLAKTVSEADRSTIRKFSASRGWAVGFVKRHGLRYVALHGESGSIDSARLTESIQIIRERLRLYAASEMYNVDETGLFCKLLPRTSYLKQSENAKSLRGVQSMSAKDRVTGYVCTNADGSHKMDMAIIGKPKNPRCFRAGSPAVPYLSQQNAWSDAGTFRKWFLEVFLSSIRKRTTKAVVLLVDNSGPHGSDLEDPRGQVTIIALPPNCTARHHPMYMGVISTWKRNYRIVLLRNLLLDIETRSERKLQNVGLKPGMKGMKEGYDPHLLDVTTMVKESWDQVSAATIARCWIQSQILPVGREAELAEKFGRVTQESNEVIQNGLQSVKKLTASLTPQDSLFPQVDMSVGESDIEKWMAIEEDDSVQEAMVSDSFEQLSNLDAVDEVSTAPNQPDDPDGECELSSPFPPASEITKMFKQLEEISYECSVPEAGDFLAKAKDALLKAEKISRPTESLPVPPPPPPT